MIRSMRILFRFDFPSSTMRLWDGSGPYIDDEGELWKGVVITEGLDTIEAALNGEAVSLTMGISGVSPESANIAWEEFIAGDVVGAAVWIFSQPMDEYFQPAAEPEALFAGHVDNILLDDTASGETITSTVMIEIVNRFTLRTLEAGRVLSNADQQRRSAVLNPGATPDRICERVPKLQDKTIRWPRWS